MENRLTHLEGKLNTKFEVLLERSPTISVTRMSSRNKSYFYELTTKYAVFPFLTMIILHSWVAVLQGRKQSICCKIFFVLKSWPFLVKIYKKYNTAAARAAISDQKYHCSFAGTLKLLRPDWQICVPIYKDVWGFLYPTIAISLLH